MTTRDLTDPGVGETRLACLCGAPLALEIHDLFRLVAGERLTCAGCGSEVGIDVAKGGEGVETLRRFCDGVRDAAVLGATFGRRPSAAPNGRVASTLTASASPATGQHRPGPRYAIRKPGGASSDSGVATGSQRGHGRRPHSSDRD